MSQIEINEVTTLSREGEIAVITVDNPPVNALGHAVRDGVVKALEAIGDARAVVLACAGRTFFAGADIREFGKPPKEPGLNEMIAALEDCPVPVVAAMHGTALGGGLETALGCDYRVIAASGKAGLPEIDLGLIPGAGGTQRAPRLMGLEGAYELILSGKPMDAKAALGFGLVDEIAEGDVKAAALAFARRVSEKRVVRDLPAPAADAEAEAAARKTFGRSRRGQFAADAAIEAISLSAELDFEAGLAKERALFLGLVSGDQSRAMRHMFFAERLAPKVEGLTAEPRELKTIGVVGAGTMGGGIAMAFADHGFDVALYDVNPDALAAGRARIAKLYNASAAKGRYSQDEAEARLARIRLVEGYQGFADRDLVIEAVFERMDIKRAVFAELDRHCAGEAILASNTSYLDIDDLVAGTKDPGRVLGLHFFSPANVMKLLEVVRGAKTRDEVLASALKAGRKAGKIAVVSGVCHGFIGNRMLKGYGREAGLCLIEGASPQQVDTALTGFGMPMGPFAMGDLAGLDIGYDNRKSLQAGVDYEPLAALVHDRLVEMGRKGQKTGRGFYIYDENRKASPDPEIDALVEEAAREAGITRRAISDEEIVERCMLALINEGAEILREGIAQRASDIDVVYANGYGFPRWRGGPMFYGDALGIMTLNERIRHYADVHGDKWWSVSPLIPALAAAGKGFAEWSKAG